MLIASELVVLYVVREGTAISASLLRQARLRAGLSQGELAKRVGKPSVQIGRWETGVVAPSLETLLELLRACDFDLSIDLVRYEPPANDAELVALQRELPVDRLAGMMRRARGEESGS